MTRLSHEDYKIGWICALPLELTAALAMLDDTHERLPQHKNDDNSYVLGRIGDHNVVIATLPDKETGTNSATQVAAHLLRTFDSVRVGLMVGIGGGVPSPENDIRLGDIVVSRPTNDTGGVIQYDYGKHLPDGFQQSGILLNPPPRVLRGAIAQMKARQPLPSHNSLSHHLSTSTNPRLPPEFTYPAGERDELFKAKYLHIGGGTCGGCNRANLVGRDARPDPCIPVVHYGIIASGNQVMKDALLRDQLAAKYNILCFEMEAAGLKIALPCLVIRGISDYSDSHKNQQWQKYAAATAAAYAKELLKYVPIEKILETDSPSTTVVPGITPSGSNLSPATDSSVTTGVSSVNTTSHARFSPIGPPGPKIRPPNTRSNKASPRLNLLISPFQKTSEKPHITYQRLLSRNSFGNALYWPVDVTDIFPGCVGYFNENGHWKKLKTDVKSDGKKLPSDIGRVDSGDFACGVITSSNVRQIDFDLTASIEYIPSYEEDLTGYSGTVAGIPAAAEFRIQVSSMHKGAALLQCDSVTRNTITGNVNALKEWGAANAKYLFEKEPDTREYGFVVVTSTFRTPKCSLRCWPKTDDTYSPTSDEVAIRSKVSGHILAQWGQSGWIKVPVKEDSVGLDHL